MKLSVLGFKWIFVAHEFTDNVMKTLQKIYRRNKGDGSLFFIASSNKLLVGGCVFTS